MTTIVNDLQTMSNDVHHLVQMANDIGSFFRSQADREQAIAGIDNHIVSFWTRRMREKLIAHLDDGETILDELPLAAVRRIAARSLAAGTAAATDG